MQERASKAAVMFLCLRSTCLCSLKRLLRQSELPAVFLKASEKTPASVRPPRSFPQGGCALALCLVRRPRAHLTRLAAEALFAAARAELEVVDAATPVRTSVSVCVFLDHQIDLRRAKCGRRAKCFLERRWVLLKIPRCDIDGVGEGK